MIVPTLLISLYFLVGVFANTDNTDNWPNTLKYPSIAVRDTSITSNQIFEFVSGTQYSFTEPMFSAASATAQTDSSLRFDYRMNPAWKQTFYKGGMTQVYTISADNAADLTKTSLECSFIGDKGVLNTNSLTYSAVIPKIMIDTCTSTNNKRIAPNVSSTDTSDCFKIENERIKQTETVNFVKYVSLNPTSCLQVNQNVCNEENTECQDACAKETDCIGFRYYRHKGNHRGQHGESGGLCHHMKIGYDITSMDTVVVDTTFAFAHYGVLHDDRDTPCYRSTTDIHLAISSCSDEMDTLQKAQDCSSPAMWYSIQTEDTDNQNIRYNINYTFSGKALDTTNQNPGTVTIGSTAQPEKWVAKNSELNKPVFCENGSTNNDCSQNPMTTPLETDSVFKFSIDDKIAPRITPADVESNPLFKFKQLQLIAHTLDEHDGMNEDDKTTCDDNKCRTFTSKNEVNGIRNQNSNTMSFSIDLNELKSNNGVSLFYPNEVYMLVVKLAFTDTDDEDNTFSATSDEDSFNVFMVKVGTSNSTDTGTDDDDDGTDDGTNSTTPLWAIAVGSSVGVFGIILWAYVIKLMMPKKGKNQESTGVIDTKSLDAVANDESTSAETQRLLTYKLHKAI